MAGHWAGVTGGDTKRCFAEEALGKKRLLGRTRGGILIWLVKRFVTMNSINRFFIEF